MSAVSTTKIDAGEAQRRRRLHEHPDVRQFIKFCLVGASSTVINFVCVNLLYYKAGVSQIPAVVIAFFVSAINGFVWNRAWTFKEKRGRSATNQYVKYVLVNAVGLLLDVFIVACVLALFGQHGGSVRTFQDFLNVVGIVLFHKGKERFGPLLLNGALLAATGVVVFWNYFANRHWTFKH